MTKDEFLQKMRENPYKLLSEEIPTDWMATAWEIDEVREELTYDMSRTVSKMGQLFETDQYLAFLEGSLSVERQVELFNRIRKRSPHREGEFRPRFEQMFPRSVSHLPPPLTRQEALEWLGRHEEDEGLVFGNDGGD